MAYYQLLTIYHSQSLGFTVINYPILDVLMIRLHYQMISIHHPADLSGFNYPTHHVRSKTINTIIIVSITIYYFRITVQSTTTITTPSSTAYFLSKRFFTVITQEVL